MEQQWTQALHDCTKRKEWTEVRDFVDRNAVLFGNSDSSNEEHGEGTRGRRRARREQGVSANLELGYLTIKSLLHNREDLPSHADDIHGALANARASAAPRRRGPGGDGDDDDEPGSAASLAAVAADLVSWCALEAELGTVQKRLNGMLGEDGDAASEQAKAAAVEARPRGAAGKSAGGGGGGRPRVARAAGSQHELFVLPQLGDGRVVVGGAGELPAARRGRQGRGDPGRGAGAAYHDAAGVDFFDDDPTADNGNSFSWSGYVAHGTVVSEVAEAKDAKDEPPASKAPESFRGLSVDTRELPPSPKRVAPPPPIGLPSPSPAAGRKMSTWGKRLPRLRSRGRRGRCRTSTSPPPCATSPTCSRLRTDEPRGAADLDGDEAAEVDAHRLGRHRTLAAEIAANQKMLDDLKREPAFSGDAPVPTTTELGAGAHGRRRRRLLRAGRTTPA
ncbi:hypothetical protein JL722_1388 [Aureococcus anophagefferens]|nr:hypothetical protein JL722_1388 [Aureococcus anophagefferens]